MISLAGRDILHSWSKFVLTGVGLGLLIGVTLTMTGVYRGMVDDARMLLANSRADLWVVQQDTQGPYAESSSLRDDTVRSILGLTGVAQAANVTYFTMQVRSGARDVRAMVVGFEPGQPGAPGFLVAGRHVTRSHYEAVADVATGLALALLVGGGLVAWALADAEFRGSADNLLAGLGIGGVIAAMWWIIGHLGFVAEHPETLEATYLGTAGGRMQALSFTSPMARTLDWVMSYDGNATLTLGVVSVAGVVIGALASTLAIRAALQVDPAAAIGG